jgi:N-acetylmuramoyl-L-alanine amidase
MEWSNSSPHQHKTQHPDTKRTAICQRAYVNAIIERLPRTVRFWLVCLLFLLAALPRAQGTAPPTPLMMVTPEGRRPVPTTLSGGQELIALNDVATLFQVTVREDALAGGLTVSYRGRTIVASQDQPMASVDGRVITLPAPAVRSGQRWLVPVEFLQRALAPIYDRPIDLRRASRLLIVGDVNIPRVTTRVDTTGPVTRATIEISPPATVTAAGNASRVELRVDADAIDLALPASGGGLIDQIRPGDQQNTVALILTPGAGAARAESVTTGNVTTVTVEIPPAAPPAATEAPAASPLPPPAAEVPPLVTRAVLQTIVIDPGHGGDDIGAQGRSGLQEKQVTLDVARRLRTLIETQLGVRVVLTREDDRAVGPDQRAAMANNSKADLFLSLHLNAAPSPAIGGAEVFHLRLDREGEIARRDAAADAVTLPVLGGGTRTIDVIRWDLAQARYVDSSATLARLLESELRRGQVALGPRPVQQAPLRVLTGANMPAALVEMAYLTNPSQERLVSSDDYKNRIARAIFDAIVRFRDHLEERRAE